FDNKGAFPHSIWQNGINDMSSGAPAPGIGDYIRTDQKNRPTSDREITILSCPELEMRRPARYALKRNYSMNQFTAYDILWGPIQSHNDIQDPSEMAW